MVGLFALVLLEEQWDCLLPEWLRLVKVVELMTLFILIKAFCKIPCPDVL
jgi:hypothetical protein